MTAEPTHIGPPYYGLADLAAELESRELLHLLDAQLAKPCLGNARFAAGRARCRERWLASPCRRPYSARRPRSRGRRRMTADIWSEVRDRARAGGDLYDPGHELLDDVTTTP